MGNAGLHNLDADVHTIPVPCYAKIKHKCMLKMSSESLFCFFILWGLNSHPPAPLIWLWCVWILFFASIRGVKTHKQGFLLLQMCDECRRRGCLQGRFKSWSLNNSQSRHSDELKVSEPLLFLMIYTDHMIKYLFMTCAAVIAVHSSLVSVLLSGLFSHLCNFCLMLCQNICQRSKSKGSQRQSKVEGRERDKKMDYPASRVHRTDQRLKIKACFL